jgi:hypothetical protein
MAAAGTLLADLDTPTGDGDLVQKILSDMNVPTQHANRPAPPPLPAQPPVYQQEMASTTSHIPMDSRIPTSHIIGNEHPSPADFASAMGGVQTTMNTMPSSHVYETVASPSKNIYSRLIDEVKVPLVVAILFFIFSLPPIRVLFAHYLPTLVKQTGDFHLTGLLVVSAAAGATFWLLQRVIAPLLSL